jgi:hypothetical protein
VSAPGSLLHTDFYINTNVHIQSTHYLSVVSWSGVSDKVGQCTKANREEVDVVDKQETISVSQSREDSIERLPVDQHDGQEQHGRDRSGLNGAADGGASPAPVTFT